MHRRVYGLVAHRFGIVAGLLLLSAAAWARSTGATVQIMSPRAGATVSGIVTISAQASANIKQVNFYIDGSMIGSDAVSPYSVSWNSTSAPNGRNTLSVNAYGGSGKLMASSTEVVNVSNSTSSPIPTPTPSATPTPSPTPTPVALDQYGGVSSIACPNGPRRHFYTQKVGDRWWLCTPAGHGFYMRGVVGVNYAWTPLWYSGALQTKYGSAYNPYVVSSAEDPADVWGFNYAIEQVNRLRAWGFNWLADGTNSMLWPTNPDVRWNTADHTIPDQFKMPFADGLNTTRYAMLPSGGTNGCNTSYPLKDMINGVGAAFTAYHYNFGDYFDPHFPACASLLWNSILSPLMALPHTDYLMYLTIDESDQTGGVLGTGPDFTTVNVNNGQPNAPISPAAHAAWVTLATKPVQTTANVLGTPKSYPDCSTYSKIQLINQLVTKYGDISGLNAAWNSHYTSFWSSQGGYTTAANWRSENCSAYTSWGSGTGVIDEDGTCPSKGAKACWMGDDIKLSGETPAMQADMSAFLKDYVGHYLSVLTGAIHTYAPGVLTQMAMGGYGNPPRREVLMQAATYLDLPQLLLPPYCPTCTDIQQRIDLTSRYLGDKPWMMWEGFFANPDSAESAHIRNDNMATAQSGRAAVYQQMVSLLVNSKSAVYNDYPVVGFYWWDLYDSDGEGLNWGLMTPSDNPYDGMSAVIASGVDQWGYSTGGEAGNYGDVLDGVNTANKGAISLMLP